MHGGHLSKAEKAACDRLAATACALLFARLALLPVIIMQLLSGCITEPTFHEDRELRSILEAYQNRVGRLDRQQIAEDKAGIRQLRVERQADGSHLISVDLIEAPVRIVVQSILRRTHDSTFGLPDAHLSGRITIKFSRLGLVEALNRLLEMTGLSVVDDDGFLVFRHSTRIRPMPLDPEVDEAAPGRMAYREMTLRHVSADDAIALLQQLYWGGEETQNEAEISFGSLKQLNSVYLTGNPKLVAEAIGVLSQADRDVPHVLIEALLVEFDATEFAQFGTTVSDIASGPVSNGKIAPGQVSFSVLNGDLNSTQLTALIDFLVSHDKAQVLSRPYITTRSTQTATINIINERLIALTQDDEEGNSVSSSDSLDAGVKLEVTPTVHAGGKVRLDLSIEESQFVPTVGTALAEKDTNTASTSVTVNSGHTVVIGGLNIRRRVTTNLGFPWLRNVPLLNTLAANRVSLNENKELVIYLTTRMWEPDYRPPIERLDTLSVKNEIETNVERPVGIIVPVEQGAQIAPGLIDR